MPRSFPDHFSKQARDYARYRPVYPAKLYDYLALLTPHPDRAWDVGTATGKPQSGWSGITEFAAAWGAASLRVVRWPLCLQVGRLRE